MPPRTGQGGVVADSVSALLLRAFAVLKEATAVAAKQRDQESDAFWTATGIMSLDMLGLESLMSSIFILQVFVFSLVFIVFLIFLSVYSGVLPPGSGFQTLRIANFQTSPSGVPSESSVVFLCSLESIMANRFNRFSLESTTDFPLKIQHFFLGCHSSCKRM